MEVTEILEPREDGELTVEDRKFLARCKTEHEVASHLAELLKELVWVKQRAVDGITPPDLTEVVETVHQVKACREIIGDIAAGRFVTFKKLPTLLGCFGIHRVVDQLNDGSEEGFAGLENAGQVATAEHIAPIADVDFPLVKPMPDLSQLYRYNTDGELEPVDSEVVRRELNTNYNLRVARAEGKHLKVRKVERDKPES